MLTPAPKPPSIPERRSRTSLTEATVPSSMMMESPSESSASTREIWASGEPTTHTPPPP